MTNRQIGSIRIHAQETYAELAADCVDKFFELVGDGGKLEKNIIVKRLDYVPEAPKGRIDRSNRPNRHANKKKGYSDKSKDGFKKNPNPNPKSDDAPWDAKPKAEGGKKKHKGNFDGKPKGPRTKKDGAPLGGKKKKVFKGKKKKG